MEQSKTQEEQFRHQWNQQLADKDIIIVELQDKLDSVLQPRMSSARSRDELETISDNEGGLVAITKQLHHVVQSITVRIFNIQSCYETKKSVNSNTKVQKIYLIIQSKMAFLEYLFEF